MSEAELILPNMRGGCVRVGNKVHTLFRLTSIPPVKSTAADRHPGTACLLATRDAASSANGEAAAS